MTNVSDVLEPRECRQSSPLRSSFLLVPFSDASSTESRASSPALFQGLYTMCRYHCLIQTTPLRCAHSVSYLASGGILGRARWKHGEYFVLGRHGVHLLTSSSQNEG
ncbi:hypothetical protein L226DRAFT_367044 [Lentinus tigrinus ALCF2SS1-7]|uniref:uncharacterized protein n=1 Tax=Lentinus tigrinus ALCF2SS1-7 TaxID=1328758 RepID=UPI0011661450|nr:hypothetical protein L226DRAFT_367044 [Lentinus tigrinus ALCF2SS1-7]